MTIDYLIRMVEMWAEERGIFSKATPASQFEKTVEEVGEVARALIEGDDVKLVDGIGDVLVTLVILCKMKGLTIHECLNAAYEEIADRKGQMVDGVFVKEGE